MTEKTKQTFEGLSLSMRFVLPILGMLYWYNYQGDIHSIKDSIADVKQAQTQNITDVKQSQAKIWDSINSLKDSTSAQFIQIYQRIK